MINSCTVRSRKLDPSNRELWILVCALMAVLAAGMGIPSTALLVAVPAVGAGTSDLGRGFSLGKDFAPNEQNYQAGISSPATGESVSGVVPIVGTASGSQFARYELYFKAEPSGDEAYVWFTGRHSTGSQRPAWCLVYRRSDARKLYAAAAGRSSRWKLRRVFCQKHQSEPERGNANPGRGPRRHRSRLTRLRLYRSQRWRRSRSSSRTSKSLPRRSTPTTAPAAPGDGGGTNQGQASSTGQPVIEQSQGVLSDLGESLSLNRLRARFITGVRWSAGLFLLLGAILRGQASAGVGDCENGLARFACPAGDEAISRATQFDN